MNGKPERDMFIMQVKVLHIMTSLHIVVHMPLPSTAKSFDSVT